MHSHYHPLWEGDIRRDHVEQLRPAGLYNLVGCKAARLCGLWIDLALRVLEQIGSWLGNMNHQTHEEGKENSYHRNDRSRSSFLEELLLHNLIFIVRKYRTSLNKQAEIEKEMY